MLEDIVNQFLKDLFYLKADTPPQIVELFRRTRACVKPYIPEFKVFQNISPDKSGKINYPPFVSFGCMKDFPEILHTSETDKRRIIDFTRLVRANIQLSSV